MDDDLERSITRRERRSPGYRARLAGELRQQSVSTGKPAAAKGRRVTDTGAPGPDKRVRRKRVVAPGSDAVERSPRQSSPVLTELSAKLSSTAQAMRAALDRRAGQ